MTMTYTFDNLKDDVRKEAEALRVHATKEELNKLDFENLDYSDRTRCIYGQMTGNCFSLRSAELINNCAITHFEDLPDAVDEITDYVKEKEKYFLDKRTDPWVPATYSAIEAYICFPEARNANLISFLREETETLEL
jgi:hypothetical protein